MNILQQTASIIYPDRDGFIKQLKNCEYMARLCYNSQGSQTEESWKTFLPNLMKSGHMSPLEHSLVSVQITTNRGVSHEIVRHRHIAISQQSTRYCNYSKAKFNNQVTFIKPEDYNSWPETATKMYEKQLEDIEQTYMAMSNLGCKPEQCRAILPNSLKTEIGISASFREWLAIFKLRTFGFVGKPHPDIQIITQVIYEQFNSIAPEIFNIILMDQLIKGGKV
jgi:thymidylate synthase (FAD)